MKKSIKDYMREIESIYKTTAGEVAKDFAEMQKLQKEYKGILSSKDLTPAGKEKRYKEIDEKIKTLKADISALRADANLKAKDTRRTVEMLFYDYYHAIPADVDENTLTLIESGILSDSELFHMAETANATMKRLIGKELENRGFSEGRQMQIVSNNPHLKAIDELMNVGDYACGGARLSGAGAAQTFIDRWDELTAPVFATAPDVTLVTDAFKPGERSYIDK